MPPPNAARNARIRAVTESAKRARSVLISFINGQAISHPAHCVNQLLLKGFIDLAAQIADVDIYHVRLIEVFVVLDVLGDLRTDQDATWFAQQTFEHGKFFKRKGDQMPIPPNLMSAGIQAQVGIGEDGGFRLVTRTTSERSHAGKQFLHGERLDKIIVCASIQATDAVIDIVASR